MNWGNEKNRYSGHSWRMGQLVDFRKKFGYNQIFIMKSKPNAPGQNLMGHIDKFFVLNQYNRSDDKKIPLPIHNKTISNKIKAGQEVLEAVKYSDIS